MLIFRTDASAKTGFGHLKRSVYLASLLKKKADILFCVNKDKAALRFLEERGVAYCLSKVLPSLENEQITGIVFDLRDFSPADIVWLKEAKEKGITTVQVTDLGLSQQAVDYTIDAYSEGLFPYDQGKQVLLGPDYTLLYHKFRHFNKVRRKYRAKVKNIFISLGGGVQYRRLKTLVDILKRHGFNIKVAAGFYLKKADRKALMHLCPRLRFVGKTESLARPLFEADLALITAGVAAAEAAAVGTPALYFYYHDEQKFVAQSFQKRGMGLVISNIDDLIEGNIIEKINSLNLETRIEMGRLGKQTVDGRGASRIVGFFESKGIVSV